MRRTRFHKRIRRHLLEAQQEIFVICPPGFEPECMDEIQRLFPCARILETENGGIRLEASLDFIAQANRTLRTASRILMRLGQFRAKDFHQLQKALAAIPWDLYFPAGEPPDIRVRCHRCRLYHSEAIAQRIREIFLAHASRETLISPLPELPLPALFVRGENDRFTLSVDSSGPLLHFRGLKTSGGRAPIRETLAAAILMASGYDPERPLLDPMCGSGTFSIEAALMATASPPGACRTFAWQNWPAFLVHNKKEESLPGFPPFLPSSILASDIDPASMQQLRDICEPHPLLRHIGLQTADFFSLRPQGKEKGLLVLNPPYGLRMQDAPQVLTLIRRIGPHLALHWKGWKIGLILPQGVPFLPPAGFSRRSFLHGGLSMYLFTGVPS